MFEKMKNSGTEVSLQPTFRQEYLPSGLKIRPLVETLALTPPVQGYFTYAKKMKQLSFVAHNVTPTCKKYKELPYYGFLNRAGKSTDTLYKA